MRRTFGIIAFTVLLFALTHSALYGQGVDKVETVTVVTQDDLKTEITAQQLRDLRTADGVAIARPGSEVVPRVAGKARIAVLPAVFQQGVRSKIEREVAERFGLSNFSVLENPGYTGHMIDALVNSRKFDVLERDALRELIREIDFSESEYADPEQSVKVGKMLNAHYVVIPEIRHMIFITSSRNIPFIGKSRKEYSGTIATSIRVVDVMTGRIASSSIGEATVEYREPSDEKEKVRMAVNFIDQLFQESARAETATVIDVVYPIRVIGISGTKITLNRGRGAIVKGELLKVFNAGEMMVDPDTGEQLGFHEVEVAQIRVTDVQPRFCIAEILHIEDGQSVRKFDVARRAGKEKYQRQNFPPTAPRID